MHVQTVALDFDVVMHDYTEGWKDGSIYGELVPGTVEAIDFLIRHYSVYILTARDPLQVVEWLEPQIQWPLMIDVRYMQDGAVVHTDPERIFWNERRRILVTQKKLAAYAYIDDRAIRWTSWEQALASLHHYVSLEAK